MANMKLVAESSFSTVLVLEDEVIDEDELDDDDDSEIENNPNELKDGSTHLNSAEHYYSVCPLDKIAQICHNPLNTTTYTPKYFI